MAIIRPSQPCFIPVKGIVHPKMKILSYSLSCCSKPTWVSFLCWTQKTLFWKMLVTRQRQ